MPIQDKVRQYLDKNRILYDVCETTPFTSLPAAAAGVPCSATVQTVLLKDDIGLILVLVPADQMLDLDALGKLLHRRLESASEQQIKQVFPGCDPQFVPPLAGLYGLRSIVSEALAACTDLYFAAGDACRLFRVSSKDFFNVLNSGRLADRFTRARAVPADTAVQLGDSPAKDLKQRIQTLKELPVMPQMAQRIFELRADPMADAGRLAKIIELDPSLAAQVLRYARSPFFGYRGHVDSVQAAISRVLGFEMVMNLALGLAAARPFKIPTLGPLGLNAFWRHATYSAALVQGLGRELPRHVRPPAGLSYLAGLLHNIGYLLLGHLFKPEFCALNSAVDEHPQVLVTEQETRLLGVCHDELGAWLMEAWRMPPEITVAVRSHHDVHYTGPHAIYAQLVLLADHMLKEHGIGDGASHELPPEVLAALGLEEIQAVMVMNRILEGCEGLNAIAMNLAAA